MGGMLVEARVLGKSAAQNLRFLAAQAVTPV